MDVSQWLKTGNLKTPTGLPDTSKCKTSYEASIVQEQRSKIARYAVEAGVAKAARKFSGELGKNVSETTVRSMRDAYVKMRKQAGFIIAAVVWFYITQYQDAKSILSLTSLINIKLGYSFYFVAVAGGGSLVTAIIMCVAANQMDPPQNATTVAAPAGPQVFVMHSGVTQPGPAGYPQPGQPQTGYPQPGQQQPGYLQPF